MSMKCPYCNSEMILGYIQCRDGVSWSEKMRLIAAIPPLSSSSIILSSGEGAFSGSAVEAYRCAECKKIIIDYQRCFSCRRRTGTYSAGAW